MNILYVGRFSLPQDAASLRVYFLGGAMMQKGHTVDYLCADGVIEQGKTEYDGREYYGVYKKPAGRPVQFLDWLFGIKTIPALKKRLAQKQYDAVILYNVAAGVCKKAMRLCRQKGIAVLQDVTEWYEAGHGKSLPISLFAKAVERRILHYDKKSDGIIAISPYLYNHYKDKVPTIQIPPVFAQPSEEMTTDEPLCEQKRPIRFLYAGSPSKKDELWQFLSAVQAVNASAIQVEMTVIGAPIPQNAPTLAQQGIRFFSRMPHEAVLEHLRKADFSVILRRAERFAMAGYSTKVAEAQLCGVPVFCNEIGGADADITTGENGYKVADLQPQTLIKALQTLSQYTREQLTQLKAGAAAFGKVHYTLDTYVQALDEFLLQCVQKKSS